MAARPRPIVVVDTSVFLADAMSTTGTAAASQVLAILPAIAHVVLCDEIRQELNEKLTEYLGWTEGQVLARYGPVFDVAVWVTPVAEQAWHLKVVHEDPGDTMLPRAAEAVFTERPDLIDVDQGRFVVSQNTSDLVPGSSYASFMFVTARELLERIK